MNYFFDVFSASFSFCSSSNFLISSSTSGCVKIWNTVFPSTLFRVAISTENIEIKLCIDGKATIRQKRQLHNQEMAAYGVTLNSELQNNDDFMLDVIFDNRKYGKCDDILRNEDFKAKARKLVFMDPTNLYYTVYLPHIHSYAIDVSHKTVFIYV